MLRFLLVLFSDRLGLMSLAAAGRDLDALEGGRKLGYVVEAADPAMVIWLTSIAVCSFIRDALIGLEFVHLGSWLRVRRLRNVFGLACV